MSSVMVTIYGEVMKNFEESVKFLKSKVAEVMSQVIVECPTPIFKTIEKYKPVLCGSAISSIYHGEPVHDFDFYFRTNEDVREVMDKYCEPPTVDESEEVIADWHDYDGATQIPKIPGKSFTYNAITFKPTKNYKYVIQFVLRNNVNECRNNFDFIHCMPVYDFFNDTLYISEAQFQSISEKRLILSKNMQGLPDPKRVKKFMNRGWSAKAMDML